jgi:hypothetical protein
LRELEGAEGGREGGKVAEEEQQQTKKDCKKDRNIEREEEMGEQKEETCRQTHRWHRTLPHPPETHSNTKSTKKKEEAAATATATYSRCDRLFFFFPSNYLHPPSFPPSLPPPGGLIPLSFSTIDASGGFCFTASRWAAWAASICFAPVENEGGREGGKEGSMGG